jgi:hypothetical protein
MKTTDFIMQKLILITGLLLGSVLLHAQTNYAVMVLDSRNGNPINGASIKIKSTGEILTTGQSGNVVILASSADSLHIQSKGYKDRAISLVNQSVAISIVMEPKPKVVASKPKKKNH